MWAEGAVGSSRLMLLSVVARPNRDLCNVAPDLMEGFGLMKSFREIIQNQLLFEGFGIMKSFGDRKKKLILNPNFGYICRILAKKSNAETAC